MAKAIKGNAIVGQAGGPTAVINQTLVGVIEELQEYDHIRHLLGARHGVRGIVEENFIDLKRQPRTMLDLVAATPGSALGATRDRPDIDYCQKIFESFRKHDIRYFFYIGGNDSAEAAQIVHQVASGAVAGEVLFDHCIWRAEGVTHVSHGEDQPPGTEFLQDVTQALNREGIHAAVPV